MGRFRSKGFGARGRIQRPMARRRTKRVLKPRAPARVRRTKRAKKKTKSRGHHHPELVGLVLVALGLFLGSVLWVGWNGGYVGGWIGDGLEELVGGAAFALPIALVVVGGLMVGRSDLVDVRPFRTGLAVLGIGLLLTLGSEGGYLGTALGDASASPWAAPGSRSSAPSASSPGSCCSAAPPRAH